VPVPVFCCNLLQLKVAKGVFPFIGKWFRFSLSSFMANTRRTNLRQIADALGLSASTVSRALRELPGIHPETRQAVFDTAQRLGYRGGELVQQQTFRNILTVSQSIGSRTDHEYLSGMSRAAVALNLSLVSHHYLPEECNHLLVPELQPRALAAKQVDGVVLIHRWPPEIAAALRKQLPVVSIIHEYTDADVDVVSLDDRAGVAELVTHLVEGGYKKIGFFGLNSEMTWSRSRFAGFVEAMVRFGLPWSMENVVDVTLAEASSEIPFADSPSLQRAAKVVSGGVDAWVAASELTARSLYLHLRSAGQKIPRDVGITSFHSSSNPANSGDYQFTTMDAPSAELGSSALRRLVHRIEGSDTVRRTILLPCSFRQGTTTRKVAAKK
jgi:DNA-binding LacI/PurR family transcriptional regulator